MGRVIAALVVVLAAGAVSLGLVLRERDEKASPRLPEQELPGRVLVGFQDEPTLRWGSDRAAILDRAREAGATLIRTTVEWAQAAPRRPRSPRSSFDPGYRFADVDDLARQAQARGMELLITIWGTPKWANGGQDPNRPPT